MRLRIYAFAAAVAGVVAASFGDQAQATGTLYNSYNSGGACQAASGFGAEYFYYAVDYVENTSAATQYMNCGFPSIRDALQANSTAGDQEYALNLNYFNTTTSVANISCVASVGYYGLDASSRTQVAAGSGAPPNGPGALLWWHNLPVKNAESSLGLNCAMPAGMRLGYIYVEQPKNF